MPDNFQEQRRYFELRLAQCRLTPHLCQNQVRVYEDYLRRIDAAGDMETFYQEVKSTGEMFDVAQAEVLDQRENLQFISENTGQTLKTQAHQITIDAIKASNSHLALSEKTMAAEPRSTALTNQENAAIMQITHLFQGLIDYIVEPQIEGLKEEKRKHAVLRPWNEMKSHDPELSWEKLTTYPPYKNRLPYNDAHLEILKNKFQEAVHGF